MRITPGYDFAPTEVPTNFKFTQMLAGCSLTGIAIAQISSAIIAETFTSSTGLSLPGEGYLNYDQNGFLWVRTRWGHAHLWRGNWGGWETNRFPTWAPLDTYTYPQGPATDDAMLRTHTAGNTTESAVGWRLGTNLGRLKGLSMDTMVSGTHIRWCVRGGRSVAIPDTERAPANLGAGGSPDYRLRSGSAGTGNHNAVGFPARATGAEGTGRKDALLLWQQSAAAALAWLSGTEYMQD